MGLNQFCVDSVLRDLCKVLHDQMHDLLILFLNCQAKWCLAISVWIEQHSKIVRIAFFEAFYAESCLVVFSAEVVEAVIAFYSVVIDVKDEEVVVLVALDRIAFFYYH